jgi:endonuclease/exonuclease/phosphatase family metal-dependent hydrolase
VRPSLTLLGSVGFSLLIASPCALRADEPREIVFCAYNLENYTDAIAAGEASPFGSKPKAEEAIAVLVRIIREINPDILGVCEMGAPEKFEDFRRRLNEAGLGYTDAEYLKAFDRDRHLALLSRFPIVARHSQSNITFELNGVKERVRRGFLDVVVEITSRYRLRCVGAHLKSRLPVPEDEALVRRYEAQKLRVYLDSILASDPKANLLCYGDFNASKNEPAIRAIGGVRGTPQFMDDLPCRDSLGDRWTHYWPTADEYSRVDFLFASPGLLPEVNADRHGIYRSADWNIASDHRPIFTAIRPVNSPGK